MKFTLFKIKGVLWVSYTSGVVLSIVSDRALLQYLSNGFGLVCNGGCLSTMQVFRMASATQNPICKVYLELVFKIPRSILDVKLSEFPCEIIRALFIEIAPTFYAVKFWIDVFSGFICTALNERAI